MGERPDPRAVLWQAIERAHQSDETRDQEDVILDAFAAAGLSVVGEGEVVLGGRRHRVEKAGCWDVPGEPVVAYEDDARWPVVREAGGEHETDAWRPLYVAVPIEGDDE